MREHCLEMRENEGGEGKVREQGCLYRPTELGFLGSNQ